MIYRRPTILGTLARLVGRFGVWLTSQDLRYRIDCYATLHQEARR